MERISKHLPAVTQNLELQKQEYRQLKIIEDHELHAALQEVKINRLPTIEPLKQVLRLVYIMVGLRADNFPKGVEKEMLHNFIQENYGGHTPSEIKLAWNAKQYLWN